jgi:hypothetical protein
MSDLIHSLTAQTLKSMSDLEPGQWTRTAGYHTPGDGGDALYQIQEDAESNEMDIIALSGGSAAVLTESSGVNYRMFGAIGDGENDDGVSIKRAHVYANERGIPVINLSGDYWIKQTNSIPIQTNVQWGQTTFHIDERYNSRRSPRFIVENDRPTEELDLSTELKAALLSQIKPGVQIIPELATYSGHLVTVVDEEDRIGIRAGNYSKKGWAREEFFYVEEEGRIIGDIAWSFKNFTSITVTPCSETYLTVEGGGFYFSGETPEDDSRSYHQHGIVIQRSRTIVREQWMGLERGRSDDAMVPRSGFYVLRGVYDVTLENIRCMPWEKNRVDKDRELWAGTYGIGGARMLNCQFRNLTAEGGWVAWGVFGTNLNKNFRVENCRLNRIDVHFHCWNLTIKDCEIGFKGISVTGGGDLVIENTIRHGNQFVNFRRDYGSRWEGNIRLIGCTLKPTGTGKVAVLSYHPDDFDYQYQVGFGRRITVEDLLIDFAAAPDSDAPAWLMDIVPFGRMSHGSRLFFPHRVDFRRIAVENRSRGVRLIDIPETAHYDMAEPGSHDGRRLRANCTIVCDDVDLERDIGPGDFHLSLGQGSAEPDAQSLHPRVRFTDCDDVSLVLDTAVASLSFDRCPGSQIHAAGSPPSTSKGLITVNGRVLHSHLNTENAMGTAAYLESEGIQLTEAFVSNLKSRP